MTMIKNLVTDEEKEFSDQVFFHYCKLNIVIFIQNSRRKNSGGHSLMSKFPRGFLYIVRDNISSPSSKQRTYYKCFIMQRYWDIYLPSVWSLTKCFEETWSYIYPTKRGANSQVLFFITILDNILEHIQTYKMAGLNH